MTMVLAPEKKAPPKKSEAKGETKVVEEPTPPVETAPTPEPA